MENETWTRLVYNGIDYGDYYLISNLGRFLKIKTNTLRNSFFVKNTKYSSGYFYFRMQYKKKPIRMLVHRALYFSFVDNSFTNLHIDHVNRNSLDNRIENLRAVTNRENTSNRKNISKFGTSVSFFRGGYKSSIHVSLYNKRLHLGSYGDSESALVVYKIALDIIENKENLEILDIYNAIDEYRKNNNLTKIKRRYAPRKRKDFGKPKKVPITA